ncbi:Concanavalin A-like lectin/glucanase subgroup [Penicillium macrosclerotiorum]|uniref:Concanavalin A-like lectin/glucanase subgroup n=1 Tax=Penicillium macrosclerotiorum TaxID=303699 RepID=UPI0025467BBB|nr:Concanavalin A-like lectin/glucanase subgroup [Penicillium macrosclerotiorum]KAJ5688841.1 Concanavalin A-like lectin/glucanase subgroup [Penicillium macrosclerotiorum]
MHPWDDGTMMVGTGGLYAPTIRHHDGVTYIICTNIIHNSSNIGDEYSEQFIIHTKNILSGEWSDPIIFPFPGIDPSLLFDDDRVYVQLCKTGPDFEIFNLEIDIETGKILTEPALIWTGWAKKYTEGPHIYKKDGWYYLLCAEGGTFRHHMLSIARSKSVWGPFESHSKNPLYTAYGTTQYVQNTGHGDLFQDQQGRWWVVMIGVRLLEGRSIMGRETFLAAAEWESNEWPVIKGVVASRGSPSVINSNSLYLSPEVSWVYLRDPNLEDYHMSDNRIKIRASPAGLDEVHRAVTFVGQRQRKLVGIATVILANPRATRHVRAGLALYKDEHRFLSITADFEEQSVIFEGMNRAQSYQKNLVQKTSLDEYITLKIIYTEETLSFVFEDGQGGSECMQKVDTAVMTDFDFTGPVIGLFATGEDVEVEFSDFVVDVEVSNVELPL